jgi:hypothetical protein
MSFRAARVGDLQGPIQDVDSGLLLQDQDRRRLLMGGQSRKLFLQGGMDRAGFRWNCEEDQTREEEQRESQSGGASAMCREPAPAAVRVKRQCLYTGDLGLSNHRILLTERGGLSSSLPRRAETGSTGNH